MAELVDPQQWLVLYCSVGVHKVVDDLMHHRQGEQHLVPSTVHAMSLPVEYVGQDNDRNIDAGGISKDERKKRRQGEHTH